MLFAYTYVPHQMEKMQEFIDFIFHKVWCRAPMCGDFKLELFDDKPELREVMESFYYSDKQNADFFYGNVEKIYLHFARFSLKQIRKLKWWYLSNNNIEGLCSNQIGLHATHYSDIERKFPDLLNDLKKFFTGLYNFEAKEMSRKVGKIDEHYQAFVEINKSGKCPFCGINDLFGEYHSKREAYDHYLPKAIYPFSSINFKNLVPACHHCNSSYKTSKDPSYSPKAHTRSVERRAAFYPYSTEQHAIVIKVELTNTDIENLKPEDINLQFGPDAVNEKIETWKDIYGVEERYKAKLCAKNDGKEWLVQVFDEWKHLGRDPDDFLQSVDLNFQIRPFTDSNFLKKPFLDACQRIGLFEESYLNMLS
ncbi:hypothetical protein J3998_01320 [Thiomicrorhabdus sp. 6S2-11]|uniref:HNH endonuclease n=1 Tax=Thiomicrorhabdus marina TaxID=2818442 RepID=A0ABS3Q1J9_9GAMM|nr:hypothetical protein [Thiomicrorhabdus marina]MBO1926201.1 hypothetical protein [Thiomicrorhabdus marina]